jgi:hypothetical protein
MRPEQRAFADGRKPAATHVSGQPLCEIRRRPQGRARPVRGRGDGGTRPGYFHPLSPEAHHKALELTHTIAAEVEYWPTQDPTGIEGSREQKLAAYRDVCDALSMRIRRRFARAGAASG